jgi:stage III sporulation protein AC
MDIGVLFQIAAVGILVSVLNIVLKHSGREEHAMFVTIGGIVLVLFWIVDHIVDLFSQLQVLFNL